MEGEKKSKSFLQYGTIIFFLIFLIPATSFSGDYKFYFFGVDLDYLKRRDFKMIALGAVTSVAVHIASHHVYAHLNNIDVKQDGTKEHIPGDTERSKKREFALAGFAGQHLIGLFLTSFEATRHSDFTRGYVAAAGIETLTYPLFHRDSGDFVMSDDNGGNRNLEYGVFSAIAIHNVLRVKWYHEKQE